MSKAYIIGLAALALACQNNPPSSTGGTGGSDGKLPFCYPDPEKSPELEASLVAELVANCKEPVATCPAAPAILEKYRVLRQRIIICK